MTDLSSLSAAQIKEILEQVEREEKAALTQVGLEFLSELVAKNTVKASSSEGSDWHGFRVNSLGFNVDGVAYTASIVVTDVKKTEAAREARKGAEKALKEAAKKAADVQKALTEAQSNPEKYEALRQTLAKAGIQVPQHTAEAS